ncbi:hypothetical protein BASA81_014328 [Batrachochytrium salamandrivorans]|nr:hypothetical protein BASA81_014328 [Batrachochytrium salamandrivorans]
MPPLCFSIPVPRHTGCLPYTQFSLVTYNSPRPITLNTIPNLSNPYGNHGIPRGNRRFSTDRLRSLEIENQALQQGIRPENLREPKAALPDKFDGTRRHFRGFINQMELVFQLQDKRNKVSETKIPGSQPRNQPCAIYAAEFRQLTADIDWNDAALRSQFYSGLSSEIKDHLVHCESPVSLAAAMDQAIRIDNRIFERKQEQQYNPRQFRRNQPPTQPASRTHPQQYQHRYVDNFNHHPIQQPSAPITSTPVQPRRTTDDMDIDFARRGPLTTTERQQRFSQGLCLVCGKSGHLKATCPRSNSRFRPQRQVQAIEMEGHSNEAFGKRSRPTLSRDLDSAVKLLPPEALRTDMMNMEDGDRIGEL